MRDRVCIERQNLFIFGICSLLGYENLLGHYNTASTTIGVRREDYLCLLSTEAHMTWCCQKAGPRFAIENKLLGWDPCISITFTFVQCSVQFRDVTESCSLGSANPYRSMHAHAFILRPADLRSTSMGVNKRMRDASNYFLRNEYYAADRSRYRCPDR